MRRIAAVVLVGGAGHMGACAEPRALAGPGGECFRIEDCREGLVCIENACSRDLNAIESMVDGPQMMMPPMPGDAGGDGMPPPDPGADSGGGGAGGSSPDGGGMAGMPAGGGGGAPPMDAAPAPPPPVDAATD